MLLKEKIQLSFHVQSGHKKTKSTMTMLIFRTSEVKMKMADILYGSGLRILQNKYYVVTAYESDLNKPYKINRFIKKL